MSKEMSGGGNRELEDLKLKPLKTMTKDLDMIASPSANIRFRKEKLQTCEEYVKTRHDQSALNRESQVNVLDWVHVDSSAK